MTIDDFREPKELRCHTSLITVGNGGIKATKDNKYKFIYDHGNIVHFTNDLGLPHVIYFENLSKWFEIGVKTEPKK